jgi:hypothetical protein
MNLESPTSIRNILPDKFNDEPHPTIRLKRDTSVGFLDLRSGAKLDVTFSQ